MGKPFIIKRPLPGTSKPGDNPPTVWALSKGAANRRNKPITLYTGDKAVKAK